MSNTFTQRELEILRLLANGKQNKSIARELGISPFTVRDHLSAIFKKTGVASRFELGLLAVRGGYSVDSREDKSLLDL
ncbi:LuxR C-terminal-related transcriptional regulator [Massilia pinisoli]|uniref:LuxR C-terminal-related transcriptional regulator n=1 Tax=Massilia pinisoli TaxID=1772194 RepID=A0ABT1ZUH1_9BURK|nr:LuxR C-terminal-related transcriptional regulator [Massilia pinisoli]MCS0583578.1 LuxR C-terminal-related transcriptional regulator [Massilia pinisoli]